MKSPCKISISRLIQNMIVFCPKHYKTTTTMVAKRFTVTLFFLVFYLVLIESKRPTGGNLKIQNCVQKSYSGSPVTIPDSFDLRTQSSCISPIRDQGNCGSCWAFASTQALTDRFCIAANNTVKRLLSPQQLVNCDLTCQVPQLGINCDNGCTGGFIDNAWEYLHITGGTGDSCIPYTGLDATCPNPYCSSDNVIYTSQTCYILSTVTDMQIDMLLYGTLSAGMEIYDDFYTYTSGIYTVQSTNQDGGHVVRLIGWGVSDGVPYWIAANQWSIYWGEDGYFQIRRGTNEASIESFVVAALPNLTALTVREYENYPPPATGANISLNFSVIGALVIVQLLYAHLF